MRTVYLGTSDFAAGVLERLAASEHRPALVVTRPDRKRGRGQKLGAPPVADTTRELGIELIQPEDLHAPEVLERIAAARPEALCVCAYGALIKEPLLSSYELFNVHPSLLPRWRGAAPVERAIMAGDPETGMSIMRLVAELDAGPVCLQERVPIGPDDDYGTVAARLQELGGDLLVRALDERPPFLEQDHTRARYADKIGPRDRDLDPTRPPERAERVVRALRPHIGARIALPDGNYLGVWSARVGGPTLAAAGGRVRTEGERLFLDCDGGALELLEVQPPGGRRMAAAEWLRGRPDPRLTDFWMDATMPHLELEDLLALAVADWERESEWAPFLAALCWRGSREVLEAMHELARGSDVRERGVAAYVLGQLGVPTRAFVNESAQALEQLAEGETEPSVLAAIAHAFGNLGDGHGLDALLSLRDHPDVDVREGVARALAGRSDERALAALIELSGDSDAEIRDWATFGLGALSPQDTPELREALAARLADDHVDARVEAIHGLALRGDDRAVEPALALLAGGPSADETSDREDPWGGHALEEAAIRLAALSGDARFRPYLPELTDRWRGTSLADALERALQRTA